MLEYEVKLRALREDGKYTDVSVVSNTLDIVSANVELNMYVNYLFNLLNLQEFIHVELQALDRVVESEMQVGFYVKTWKCIYLSQNEVYTFQINIRDISF